MCIFLALAIGVLAMIQAHDYFRNREEISDMKFKLEVAHRNVMSELLLVDELRNSTNKKNKELTQKIEWQEHNLAILAESTGKYKKKPKKK